MSRLPRESKELLSSHLAIALYAGTRAGKEPMLNIYPPMPAKQWTVFTIEKVLEYTKPGKYGDAQKKKGDEFVCIAEEQRNFTVEIKRLKVGDKVKLGWNHNYVTKVTVNEEGKEFTSKAPERVITILEPLNDDK